MIVEGVKAVSINVRLSLGTPINTMVVSPVPRWIARLPPVQNVTSGDVLYNGGLIFLQAARRGGDKLPTHGLVARAFLLLGAS
jgi:hypothetical protein